MAFRYKETIFYYYYLKPLIKIIILFIYFLLFCLILFLGFFFKHSFFPAHLSVFTWVTEWRSAHVILFILYISSNAFVDHSQFPHLAKILWIQFKFFVKSSRQQLQRPFSFLQLCSMCLVDPALPDLCWQCLQAPRASLILPLLWACYLTATLQGGYECK